MILRLCMLLCVLPVAAFGALQQLKPRTSSPFARWSIDMAQAPPPQMKRSRVAKVATAVPKVVAAAAVRTALFAGRPLRLVGGAIRPRQSYDLPVLHDEDAGVSEAIPPSHACQPKIYLL